VFQPYSTDQHHLLKHSHWIFRSCEVLSGLRKAFIKIYWAWKGARGSVVGWGTMLQVGRSQVRFPDEVIGFCSRIMALGSSQLLTEMITRNLPGGKGWPAREADTLTTICEPIV
jgi:hypothetical protein